MMIPALLLGNVVVFKIPTIGGLVHFYTMEAFATAFPRGIINFISGPGREIVPCLMDKGIDMLSFVGRCKIADSLIRAHAVPHRLKTLLSLEVYITWS